MACSEANCFIVKLDTVKSLSDVDFGPRPESIKVLVCEEKGLRTLEGCPPNVEDLRVSKNQLVNLKGAPSSVKRLDCSQNLLTTLEGCPPGVTHLRCSNNQLTYLGPHCPSSVVSLGCSFNHLSSLEGCPTDLESLVCAFNFLESLQGLHRCKRILTKAYVSYNLLKTLEWCPEVRYLDASCNSITSLHHIASHQHIQELCVAHNRLESLEFAPGCVRILRCSGNRLTSLEHCPPRVEILECSKNDIQHIQPQRLPPMLRELFCARNPISHPRPFTMATLKQEHCPNLEEFHFVPS